MSRRKHLDGERQVLDRIAAGLEPADQAQLERDFDPGPSTSPTHRRVICGNPSCPDYRVERDAGTRCGCYRTSVQLGERKSR